MFPVLSRIPSTDFSIPVRPPEDVYRIMGLVKESELSPETKEADSYLPIDLGYCIDGNIVSL